MNGSGPKLQVMYVSGDDVRPAIVPDQDEDPWSVLLDGEEKVDWEVVVLLAAAPPIVFDTSESARAWAGETMRLLASWLEPGPRYSDAVEKKGNVQAKKDADAATHRADQLAAHHGLTPGSSEAMQFAHSQKAISSVCLYDTPGCARGGAYQYKVFDKDVGNLESIINWSPRSCWASAGVLYAETYGWQKRGGKRTAVGGRKCRDKLPHKIRSLRV
jgi:hypothetical protein